MENTIAEIRETYLMSDCELTDALNQVERESRTGGMGFRTAPLSERLGELAAKAAALVRASRDRR